MQIDKVTYNDIAVFQSEEEFSIFHRLDFTRTYGGREWLRRFFHEPSSDLSRILGTQNILKTILSKIDAWPADITNGTVIMMDKFLDYNLDTPPDRPNAVSAYAYRVLHTADYSMIKYSVKHFADFFRGLSKISALFRDTDLPPRMRHLLDRIDTVLADPVIRRLADTRPDEKLTLPQNLFFARQLRNRFKRDATELIDTYGRLEAWYSMAMAVKAYGLQFPQFVDSAQPLMHAEGLYHVLLDTPVPYNLTMDPAQNFVFLTGANMAGKSTLIKAVGAAVFLAHLGMGVPAASMRLSTFDGLLTNINVADNIMKGESYFFNEVQRIKNTIQKINDGRKWLVLIDELFKGTNVQDAMKCSLAVIRGLIRLRSSLFILSTHLYEIGEDLQEHSNIAFRYFETGVSDEQLQFSYGLKVGISGDRIGYLILRREGVVKMLEGL